MAIFEEQITDTIEAGAPSIKYGEGDVQRQVPENEQERVVAQQIWESLGPEQQAQFITFEQFYTSGAWKQILARMQQQQEQQEQPMAYGGIAGIGGRRRYGLGSRLRKLIPNEIAKVAEVAAPFVAPFNPAVAGLMGGLGSYDRTGKLGGALKSGLMNYAGGQAARYLGGAGVQGNPFSAQGGAFRGGLEGFKGGFSSPYKPGKDIFSKTKEKFFPGKEKITEKIFEQQVSPGDPSGAYKPNLNKAVNQGTSGIMNFIDKNAKAILLGSMGIAAATAKPQDMQEAMRASRGTGLDIDGIRAEVQEAFAAGEGAWNELKKKYPYIGDYSDKKAEGGRIGYEGGGSADPILMEEYKKYVFEMEEMGLQPMSFEDFAAQARAGMYAGGLSIPSENTMEDARKTSMQDKMGGITDVMKRADLYRQGDVGQMYAAQGGRIGYAGGSGKPPITMGQPMQAPQMPAPPPRPNPMPAPQPNRMAGMPGGMNPMMNPMMNRPMMNPMMGGRRMAQEGGLMDLGGMEKDYRNDGGFVPIGGKEKADDVPARLSKNEFVFTADAVRGAGGGDIDKGAEIMENVMKNLEQGGQISEDTQGLGGAQEMFSVSERLSEVV